MTNTTVSRGEFLFPPDFARQVEDELNAWQGSGKMRRLWDRDAALWTGADEDRWLGWLDLADDAEEASFRYRALTEEVRALGLRDVVVLGMGGSSLCPEVLGKTYGKRDGFPRLRILDSTVPAEVLSLERDLELDSTLFVVSSKSGTTLEPNVFLDYFYARVLDALGDGARAKAGERFIAVTDPGSSLESLARERSFRHVFHGVPSVGGRYSALSAFGLVPGAVMGLDVGEFLTRARRMVQETGPGRPAAENAGARLGVSMGLAARDGRDKLTLVLSERLAHLGAWIEQLVAESTGKNGKAIIPVDREPLGEPSSYGDDRFFVHVRSRESKGGVTESEAEQKIEALAAAGHPIVSIDVSDVLDLGQEFFRWEIATAVAGAVIGVNPFDQPDVEASKIATRKLTSEYEKTGRFPEESSFFEERDVRLFSDDANASALRSSARDPSLVGLLGAHLDRLRPGDYFAVLAYVKRSEEHESILRSLCLDVRDKKGVAACLGFGPRFLHSTGQAYKGGPKSGVFLQVTSDDAEDIDVPGKDYSFGAVKTAQSLGDFQVLIDRERRALRAHVSADVIAGLTEIRNAVAVALA